MLNKTGNVWNFDPEHISWPYVLLIPGVVVVSALTGIVAGDFIRWGGLVLNTTFIFGFFINASRRFTNRKRFWLLTASLFVMHVAAFLAILLRVDEWKLLWFSVMIFELPPFFLLRDLSLRNLLVE